MSDCFHLWPFRSSSRTAKSLVFAKRCSSSRSPRTVRATAAAAAAAAAAVVTSPQTEGPCFVACYEEVSALFIMTRRWNLLQVWPVSLTVLLLVASNCGPANGKRFIGKSPAMLIIRVILVDLQYPPMKTQTNAIQN